MTLSTIEDAIQDVRQGRMVIVVDDEARENEGDLVLAAQKATPEAINFMITHAKGLVCMPMQKARLEQLKIPPMIHHNDFNRCMFTMSVDYKIGTSTGISPKDRSATIQGLINPKAKAEDFAQPGHLFPLVYREGGVLVREGHTEASVDLARLAGLEPAAVICEIINEDGTMATLPDLRHFSKKHNNMKIVSIEDLKKYLQSSSRKVEAQLVHG